MLFLVQFEIVTAGSNNVVMSIIPRIALCIHQVCKQQAVPKGWLYNPVTAEPDTEQ